MRLGPTTSKFGLIVQRWLSPDSRWLGGGGFSGGRGRILERFADAVTERLKGRSSVHAAALIGPLVL